jgi:hypothetical protein
MSLRRGFRMPVILGVISAGGLVSALVGDGPWDAVSWIALGLPIGIIGFYGLRGRSTGDRPSR